MQASNPFALLADLPTGDQRVDQAKAKEKKAQQQKKKEQDLSQQKAARPAKAGTKPQLDPKAAQAFRSKNELNENQKSARNKKRKQKKAQKQKLNEKAKTLGATPAKVATQGGNEKASPVDVAALAKQVEAQKKKKLEDFFAALKSVLNGDAVFVQIDVHKFGDNPQETKEALEHIANNPYRALGTIFKSAKFRDQLNAGLPPSARLAKDKMPKMGRVHVQQALKKNEFVMHLVALLTASGLSPKNQPKSTKEALSVIDGFLEGIFGVQLSEDKEEQLDELSAEYDAANRPSNSATIFDFISAKDGKAKPEEKGKEKVEAPAQEVAPAKKEEEKSGPATQGKLNDPLSWLSEEQRKEIEEKATILAQRIPRGWRIAQIEEPLFVEYSGRDDRAGRGSGRGRGKEDVKEANGAPTASSFLYGGVGCDHCYALWCADEVYALLTTGKK